MPTPTTYPLFKEIQTHLSPPEIFELFYNEPYSFFLDSGMDPDKLGRYSFIGSKPFLVFKTRGSDITTIENGKTNQSKGNPFDTLGKLLGKYHVETQPLTVPFSGGAVGYLSYDLCHFIERLPSRALDDLQLPECYFGFYDYGLAFDNLTGITYAFSTGFPEYNEPARLDRAQSRLDELVRKVGKATYDHQSIIKKAISVKQINIHSNFTRDNYLKAVERARQYIIDGDIFEVNLSQRFEAEIEIPPYELYRRLRRINPAPFASYLNINEVKIVGSSPERFLRKSGDMVETRPIKGTRRRGKTPEEDEKLSKELLDSIKDRAENIMIVDLERNDLGRVCRYGSVRVSELTILETYPTVFHLTSTVEGKLNEGKTCIDLLRATFPGGSITGAPKVRSMEIIDELEPTRRSVYTGSIGYLGFNGDIDLNIVIRTFLVKRNNVYFQAGGAVVYDSNPAEEYQETLDKVKALFSALETPDIHSYLKSAHRW
jgi:para-aminobenzoate synthetase component 1